MELVLDYEVLHEVPEEYHRLYDEAMKIVSGAYAPYSGFQVGAALLLDNGLIVTGSNQENVAYPSGICAERTALYYANSRYPNVPVRAMLITALNEGKPVPSISPCGSCRQAMAETVQRFGDFDVLMAGASQIVKTKASSLLPFNFSMQNNL